jgi:hypothetical protein
MNRHRYEVNLNISKVVNLALIVAGILSALGGVAYAYLRNSQIQTAREIDAVEKRIEQHLLDIRTSQMRADQILNLFAIRKTLQEVGTDLVPIPAGVSEDVTPKQAPSVATASASL